MVLLLRRLSGNQNSRQFPLLTNKFNIIMETYETFKTRNANWDYCGFCTEKDMQRNYEIALQVEKTYNETFVNTNEPQIGDIVEFSDGFRVYDHAKIVENLYGGSEYGMLCVCECGSSFTNGKGFSTSGGAFKAIHKSKFEYVGEDENIVWTWGCFGAGGNQGIYFPLKVRRWKVPYNPVLKQSRVVIKGRNAKDFYGNPLDAVWIEHWANLYGHAESFKSIKAFKAWAKYVGYESKPYNGIFDRVSSQRIVRKYFWNKDEVPEDAKPIKTTESCRCVDAYVKNDGKDIVYYIPNPNILPERPKFGTKEEEAERREYRKYNGNPLGV